jgi:hypothetical protein
VAASNCGGSQRQRSMLAAICAARTAAGTFRTAMVSGPTIPSSSRPLRA